MAELEYAVLADFAAVADDGSLTLVGAHRATFHVAGTPSQHVLCVGGRLLLGRREPPAWLVLGATTPDGAVPVVAQWSVEPPAGPGAASEGGRLAACFAATLVAPVTSAGAYALTLSVNGELLRTLPFTVVDTLPGQGQHS